MNKEVIVYTDGVCSGNPGPGGWGATIKLEEETVEIYGGENNTTNKRMELIAAIKALEYLNENHKIILYTDSNYVKDGITKWIFNWKKNNWKTSAKKVVKKIVICGYNLMTFQNNRNVKRNWVKGHAGNLETSELMNSLVWV